jgi:hypothetical protein
MIAWAMGAATGHTAVALWRDEELFVCESNAKVRKKAMSSIYLKMYVHNILPFFSCLSNFKNFNTVGQYLPLYGLQSPP